MTEKGHYIFARVAGLLAVLVLSVILAMQTPRVQKSVSDKVLEQLENALDGRISVGSIQLMPFSTLLIRDLVIVDDNPYVEDRYGRGFAPADTFCRAGNVAATFSLKGLMRKEGLHFNRVSVKDGMMHLVIEPDGEYSNNLSRIFRIKAKEEDKEQLGNIFDAKKVRIRDFRYRMTSFNPTDREYGGHGINYDDMDVSVNLEGHDLRFSGGRMYGTCDSMSAKEKSGCTICNLSGDCVVGMGKTLIDNLRYSDPHSELRAKYYSMSYADATSFSDYIGSVKMEADFLPSRLAIESIMYFSGGAMYGSQGVLDISEGRFSGYVDDFRVKGLRFKELGSNVQGRADAEVIGLPDIRMMGLKYKIDTLEFDLDGIGKFIRCFAPDLDLDLSGIAPGERMLLEAKGSGTLDKLMLDANLGVAGGSTKLALDLRNLVSPERNIEITGSANAEDVNAGKLAGTDILGEVSLDTGLHASLGKNGMKIRVDSLKLGKLTAFDYAYSNINAAGLFDGEHFDGKLVCSDPNLKFIFQGILSLSKKTSNAIYKFYANLAYADLKALHLDKRGDRSKASCEMEANFKRIASNDLLGDVEIRNIMLENDEGRHDLGKISIGSHSTNNINRIQIQSSFMEGGFVGGKALSSLPADLQNITTRRHLPSLYREKAASDSGSSTYDISFNFHDSRDLLSFILPGAYIADGTALSLTVDKNGILCGRLSSGRLAYGRNYLKNVNLDLDNLDGSLNCIMASDELSVGGLGFGNPALTAYGENDNFSLGFHYDGISSVNNVGELYLNGKLLRDDSNTLVVSATPLSSYIRMDEEVWDIGESEIRYRAGDISLNNFTISSGEQLLAIDGGISSTHGDTLSVTIRDLGLGLANHFASKDLGLSGKTSGKALLTSPLGNDFGLLVNMACDSIAIGDTKAGSAKMAGFWNKGEDKANVIFRQTIDGKETLNAQASYILSSRRLDASADADNFRVDPTQPFLSGILDVISGGLNGHVHAEGPIDSLAISSNGLSLDNILLKTDLNGVAYTLNGGLHADESGLWFDSVTLSDGLGGKGEITGALRYERLRNMSLDMSLRMRNLKVLEKSVEYNAGIYGNLALNGSASLSGPFNAINANVDVRTSGAGRVNVPIKSSSASASRTNDLLVFKEKEVYMDSYELMMQTFKHKGSKSPGKFGVHAKLGIRPEVSADVDMDTGIRNRIRVNGTGDIILDLNPSTGAFSLDGNYNIYSGDYLFELPGIVSKDFSISNGSSIKFGGDIMDTRLDINAVHSLKTSLSRLIADEQSVSTRRTVDCGINISDQIRNPRLSFSISIPDLDPSTKAQVESALNTEGKVQKQFVSLLLLGSFLPNENSGINNTTSTLYSNVSEIMANQINNILSHFDIPVDLGFGYQPDDGSGTDLFDVAISTQLFNNRVIVNGSVGNRKYSNSTKAEGDMVGDLDIEVKLDKAGQIRLKLFSHSADEYTSYLDFSQRNGIGVTYQKEYDKLSEMMRSIFRRRRSSDSSERGSRGSRRTQREMNTIMIENDRQEAISDTLSVR